MFGMVGFPVGPLAEAAQKAGIPYIGMRNEQSASYAAGAVGYLTGRPGSCLVVTGPGVIHGLAGLANAQQNCWPMMLIGGASETYRNGMGAFQEERQVLIATPFCKFAHAHRARAPHPVLCRDGGPPVDLRPARRRPISTSPTTSSPATCDDGRGASRPRRCPDPPRIQTMPDDIEQALDVLQSAERPLVIVGKGMACSRAEDEVRAFIERTQAAVPRLADGQGRDARRPSAVGRRRPQPRAARSRRRVPDGRAASTGSCISACRRASTRTCASSSSTSRRRRCTRTSRPRSRSSATARRSSGSSTRRSQNAPVVLSEGNAVARGDRQEVGRERGA